MDKYIYVHKGQAQYTCMWDSVYNGGGISNWWGGKDYSICDTYLNLDRLQTEDTKHNFLKRLREKILKNVFMNSG